MTTNEDDKDDKSNYEDNHNIAHPHDLLFQKSLDHPLASREFAETHLPAYISKDVDFSTLKLEKNSFIEKDLKKHACDVLFSAKIKNQDGYLYFILEQQTEPDYLMAFRLMKYMLAICGKYLTENPKAKKLPLIYPAILYNGKKKYTVPRNFWDLFADSELAKSIWTRDHHIINLQEIPDEELKQKAWSGLMKFFLKHIRERNLIDAWEQVQHLIPRLLVEGQLGIDYLQVLLTCTLTAVEKDDKIKLEKMLKSYLNENQEEKLMTSLARHWEEEGIEKGINIGIEKGIERTAINMLKQKLDDRLICQVTGLSSEQLAMLKNKL